jgi:hypothetical protein
MNTLLLSISFTAVIVIPETAIIITKALMEDSKF